MNPKRLSYIQAGWKFLDLQPPADPSPEGKEYAISGYTETSADIRPVFKLVALNLRARTFSKLSLVTALTKRGIWSAFRDWLTETDLYDLFLAANDFREDPPSIHRGTFRSPLCSQGAVATLLVATPDRRWVCPNALPPHTI